GQLGEVDRAFEYLERALATSPGELTLIRVDPSADPLRADPRFDALLEKAGVKLPLPRAIGQETGPRPNRSLHISGVNLALSLVR
ncbi:MAG: hypothetical protein P8Y15_15880, partial [Gemmatimonadales bacterium]